MESIILKKCKGTFFDLLTTFYKESTKSIMVLAAQKTVKSTLEAANHFVSIWPESFLQQNSLLVLLLRE